MCSPHSRLVVLGLDPMKDEMTPSHSAPSLMRPATSSSGSRRHDPGARRFAALTSLAHSPSQHRLAPSEQRADSTEAVAEYYQRVMSVRRPSEASMMFASSPRLAEAASGGAVRPRGADDNLPPSTGGTAKEGRVQRQLQTRASAGARLRLTDSRSESGDTHTYGREAGSQGRGDLGAGGGKATVAADRPDARGEAAGAFHTRHQELSRKARQSLTDLIRHPASVGTPEVRGLRFADSLNQLRRSESSISPARLC